MSFVVNTILSVTLLTIATFLFSLTNGAIKESQYSNLFTTEEYTQISKKRVRKEIRDLSRTEWQRIVDAMNIMKRLSESEGVALYGNDYRNYDDLLCQHLSASWSPIYGDIAHKNVAFLPFHRAFGNAFENSLLAIDSKISGLPYWDYTIDEQAYGLNGNIENTCHVSQSEIFSEDYFGAYRGEETLNFAMIDGQFSNWRVTNEPEAHGCSKDMYDFNTEYLRGSSNYLDTPYIIRFGNGVDRYVVCVVLFCFIFISFVLFCFTKKKKCLSSITTRKRNKPIKHASMCKPGCSKLVSLCKPHMHIQILIGFAVNRVSL